MLHFLMTAVLSSFMAIAQAPETPELFLHGTGMARITIGSQVYHAASLTSGLRYSDGREVVVFSLFFPDASPMQDGASWTANVKMEARADGAEVIGIDGWGIIEIWNMSKGDRQIMVDNAGESEACSRKISIIKRSQGHFDVVTEEIEP